MFNFTAPPPLALYIHVPWCVRKCPYCDFNSHAAPEALPEKRYVEALISELERELPAVWGRQVISIFIGGGTPSLLSPEALDTLLSAVRARLPLLADAEITLEANPGTVERERFRGFREAGINRISLGIQSFHDGMLQALGRIHSGQEALLAFDAARAAGFDNINLDLMFALPGQSPAQASADLHMALSLEPEHLSWYQLTVEPNTAFHHAPPPLPDDDTRYAIYAAGRDRLGEAGYASYEVSAYARAGRQCRHNLNYWLFGDYLGIGAGAHQKITDGVAGRIIRRSRLRNPRDYLSGAERGSTLSGETTLDRDDAALEFMMNALRLTGGFPSRLFEERTGLPLTYVEQPLLQAEADGLLEWDITRIRPTERGRLYLNDLLERFVP